MTEPPVTRPAGRMPWLEAIVVEVRPETSRHSMITFDVPGWPGHRPGQRVDVRLTAEDGYTARRSYSIAAPADGTRLDLGVDLVEEGEVSPYLVSELRPGDRIELRGPIGGWFVWTPGAAQRPLAMIGAGSGVVPLRAMILARSLDPRVPATLLCSVRSFDDAPYRDELNTLAARGDGLDVVWTLTRSAPPDWSGYRRRVDAAMLAGIPLLARTGDASVGPDVFVCGPTQFVENVADLLVSMGHDATRIRTERFGASS